MLKKMKERFKSHKKERSAHGKTGSAPSSSSPSISQSSTPPTCPPASSWSSDPTYASPSVPPSTSFQLVSSVADAIPPTPSTPPAATESHDQALPSSQVEATAAQRSWITATVRRSKALLNVLNVLLGAPAIDSFLESVDVNEGVSSEQNALEEYCSRLGKLIQYLVDTEGANMPLTLKNGLNELYRELANVLKELPRSKDDPMIAEEASRKITEAVNTMITEATSHYIKDLLRVNAAYNDYTTENNRRATCFEGTRKALLKEIEEWVPQMQGSRFYLISGIAGIGKSTVAQTIAQWADRRCYLGASFFFSRDEKERRNAARFFTSIAYQLCIHDEEFALSIGRALRTKEGMDATTKDPMTQLDVLLLNPLRNIKTRSQTTAIVVDALDECDKEDGRLVLKGMKKIVEELHFLKVILTTRPQPHLRFLLDDLGTLNLVHLQNIDDKVVDDDIRRYLQYNLSQEQVEARLGQQWNACETEIESLVRGAGRLFIIASTAVLFILDEVARDPAEQMKLLQTAIEEGRTPFDSLNDFYTIILRSAVPVKYQVHSMKRYQTVVGTIVLIQNPLPIETLAKLIGINSKDIRAVLENLQPVILLSGSGDVPLVYHKSFPDYLMDAEQCRDQSLRIVPKDHHTRLALCCLRTMNKYLKHNILGLSDPARYLGNNEALEEEGRSENDVQQAIPPELQYAAIHWANHIEHADVEDSALIEELKKFCEEHVIHWFEALSWIRQLGTASVSLDVVSKFQTLDSDICEIFSDALRLISRHHHQVEQSALHTYHSALPFTPTETPLYKAFKKEMPHSLCQVEGGPTHWDARIATQPHGTSYCDVMFSPNSLQFASWDAKTLKVWNAKTGTLVRAFNGSNVAPANDFSAVALLEGSSVMVYSLSSGAPITSFDPPATVIELALSFDGSRLAIGLKNGTVSVWDVGNHKLIASLDDYACPALPLPFDRCQLAFSTSGYMLAFTSNGNINLWNGMIVARLEHESEKPDRIIFTSDGTRLVSLAEKDGVYNLRLWNGENGDLIGVAKDVGETLRILGGGSFVATGGGRGKEVQVWSGDSLSLTDTIPVDYIDSLAFFDDIRDIASPLNEALYDAKSRTSIATGQILDPFSSALSPDETRQATGSANGIVHLHGFQTLEEPPLTSEDQQTRVSELTFSPDCSRLACGFSDGTIELCDTVHARKTIARHKLHSSPVDVLAFSPDGHELASGASDVKLWDGRDCTPTGILEYTFPSPLRSMALSSSLLAVAAKDVITLWDRASQHLIHTLSQDCVSLSLSLDGSMLVFVAHNSDSTSCITVWDAEKRTPTNTINVDSRVNNLTLSPDGSRCAIWTDDALKFFDILNMKPIENLESKDLSWVPHLNGIPISLTVDVEHWYRFIGRFSARHDKVPVLWLPNDFFLSCGDARPSIIAIGSFDGNILLIRPAAEISAPI